MFWQCWAMYWQCSAMFVTHAKMTYGMRSVDDNAEKFVLAVKVFSADSIVRYREGDFNENVYIRGDGKEFRSEKTYLKKRISLNDSIRPYIK